MEKPDLKSQVEAIPFWYHKIELPGGIVTPGWAPLDAGRYCIPQDMTGLRVLDVGAWDGYWTFEALKRGAREVVAIDDFSDRLGRLSEEERPQWETFDLCREALGFTHMNSREGYQNDEGQRCFRTEKSVYDLTKKHDGEFDVIFLFGTIYHLRHPLLALDKLSEICTGSIYIESAICDNYSPYQEGGHGSDKRVMEFYPGKEYGDNSGNWWVPTLDCLGEMVRSAGFQELRMWKLNESPSGLPECRGFVCGGKDETIIPVPDVPVEAKQETKPPPKFAAVMSVPRFGPLDNAQCVFQAFAPLGISVDRVTGAYWEQSIERGIEAWIDKGADFIITLDYDTVFTKQDVEALIHIILDRPDIDAVAAVQDGRAANNPLMSLNSRTGRMMTEVPLATFDGELTRIATAHFGLTILRAEACLKMEHPWFHATPGAGGRWHTGKVDADISFWKKWESVGNTLYLANNVIVGHGQWAYGWPGQKFETILQPTEQWWANGYPKGTRNKQTKGNDNGNDKAEVQKEVGQAHSR